MAGESVLFDDSSRSSMSDQPVSGGVPRAVRMLAESAGLDVTAELYNEALGFASEGHLRLSRERLRMLLTLCPEDGESRLLLAKVEVAAQRWTEALSALDEAAAAGMDVPRELRRAVEDHLRSEIASDEEQRTAVLAREQGEIKALRQEARRLRSENAKHVGRIHELEGEARKWAWTTAAVSTLAILFIAANLIFGGGSDTPDELALVAEDAAAVAAVEGVADEVMGEVVVEDELEVEPAAPPPAQTLADRALVALSETPDLEGTSLELEVANGAAVLSGQVLTHAQRKEATRLLEGIPGIDAVDVEGVQILARTHGTLHTVKSGDTLGGIAHHYYGDSFLHKKITAANKGLSAKGLQLGQEITIPPIE